MAPGDSPRLDHPGSFWPTRVSDTDCQPFARVTVGQGQASTTLLRSGCALSFGGGPPNSINARVPLSENGILKTSTEHRQSIPHSVPSLCNAQGREGKEGSVSWRSSPFQLGADRIFLVRSESIG